MDTMLTYNTNSNTGPVCGEAGHVSNSGRLDIFCCTLPDITIPPTAENGSIRDAFPHNVFNYYFA